MNKNIDKKNASDLQTIKTHKKSEKKKSTEIDGVEHLFRFVHFFVALANVDQGVLDIVVNSVEDSALISHIW